ncbi:hypothetical protein NPIL_356751 [Nephila pilipes]|uniref:Uncharacterized protein n=1 Tax=Nephila pilipes TaxID=299642 RepID=A0A8X6UK74_NEPPI|nr:hypothetical protein NPIL_356751 [Nephila pilipes]
MSYWNYPSIHTRTHAMNGYGKMARILTYRSPIKSSIDLLGIPKKPATNVSYHNPAILSISLLTRSFHSYMEIFSTAVRAQGAILLEILLFRSGCVLAIVNNSSMVVLVGLRQGA